MKQIMFFLRYFILLCVLSSCQNIRVKHLYVSPSDLASAVVDTPDFRDQKEYRGEQLLIDWKIDQKYRAEKNFLLVLHIRYRDQTEQKFDYSLKGFRGQVIYSLIGTEYEKKQGMATYRISIYADGVEIQNWEHQVWAEKIKIIESEEEEIDNS